MGNENFELLGENDKTFIQRLIEDPNIEDFGSEIEAFC